MMSHHGYVLCIRVAQASLRENLVAGIETAHTDTYKAGLYMMVQAKY